jgi:hypothetical protein
VGLVAGAEGWEGGVGDMSGQAARRERNAYY